MESIEYYYDGLNPEIQQRVVKLPDVVNEIIIPVPEIISMRQCQLFLDSLPPIDGANVLDLIESIVPTLSRRAQIEWRTSKDVWRSSPMVEQMRIMFGWSMQQMDQMFITADTL